MKTKGIRISDIKDGKCIPLAELLETIPDETQFFWAWLWLDVTPLINEGHYLDGKCIPLGELLETIPDETQFFWAWLWLGDMIESCG